MQLKNYLLPIIFLFFQYLIAINPTFKEEAHTRIIERNDKVISEDFSKVKQIEIHDRTDLKEIHDFFIYKNKLYFFDNYSASLSTYSKDGELEQEYFFPKGKGPGEFQRLKELVIKDDFLYGLDRKKLTISKFDLSYNLIWEKRLPSDVIDNGNVFSFHIDIVNDLILLQRSVFVKNTPALFILDSNLDIIDTNLSIKRKLKKERKIDKELIVMSNTTMNISADKENVYLALTKGLDQIYCINVMDNQILYKIQNTNYQYSKPRLKHYNNGGTEVLNYQYTAGIRLTDNFIVTKEEQGAFSKSNPIPKDKNYYNNFSFYTKSGEYCFSLEDRSLPYRYNGYKFDIEEYENTLKLYVINDEINSLIIYEVKKVN